ncbi:MAG TPA: ribbon-helix-helix protein, CopG family [Gemmatimonadaceae bacterium]|nr:ribbon-helix-helix protein, CopG family [Gemmatimonadaceae bacterium]
MKESHLTLRLPADLAKALLRKARALGVPKSQMVREAVAVYLEPVVVAAAEVRRLSARELAARWNMLPRLTADEAASLGSDIAASRKALPAARSAWE